MPQSVNAQAFRITQMGGVKRDSPLLSKGVPSESQFARLWMPIPPCTTSSQTTMLTRYLVWSRAMFTRGETPLAP